MIYLHHGHAFAACESEATAQRREAMGYRRCTAKVYAALWAMANVRRLTELANEAARETAPLCDEPPAGQPPVVEMTRPPVLSSMHGWRM